VDEKQLKLLTDGFNKSIADLKAELEGKTNSEKSEEFEASIKSMTETIEQLGKVGEKALPEYLKGLQEQNDALETQIKDLKLTANKPKTFKSLLKATLESDDFKAALKKSDLNYDVKDAAEIATTNFTADSGAVALSQVEIPGVDKAPWMTNPIFAAVQKIFVSDKKHTITWSEENVRNDGAAAVAESGAYAKSDITFIKRVASFFKIGTYADYTEETMEDADELAFEFSDLITNGVLRTVEYDLLLGDGSNTFTGLIKASGGLAKAFAAPTSLALKIVTPGIPDVLRAAMLQVRNGAGGTNKKGYIANLAVVSPGTMALMDVEKTANGLYIRPPWATTNDKVKSMLVVESDDIGDDQFLVGDFSQIKLYIKRALNIKKTDSDGSKFLEDVETIKCSMRIAQKLATNKRYAFTFGTFTDAKALLAKAVG